MNEGVIDNSITIYIDDKPTKVAPGINLIEALSSVGKEIPHYCYHPKLSVVGNCRMCLIEMGTPRRDRETKELELDETGQPKIGWVPKPVIACVTQVSPGMHVRTQSKLVEDCRKGVMEFLLINHPLDCPICDQAGECRLQEFATDYGRGYSRFEEQKNVKPKRTRLGPRVMLDDERCILCSRCIRFCQEVPKDDVLGFIDRGSYSTLTCFPGKELANNYSLNTVDICPVGALTSTDFRFKMRVWFLKETQSICTESSVGCNTTVSSREGKIYRITPRRNDAVNDTWMPDSGRTLYKQVEAEERLTHYSIGGTSTDLQATIEKTAQLLLDSENIAFVGSGRSSVEEQFFGKKVIETLLAKNKNGSAHLVSRTDKGDGLLLSTDRNPNVRGALVTGMIDALPKVQLNDLAAAIESGKIETVFSHGEDLTKAGIDKKWLATINLIYCGTHANESSDAAKVVLPGETVFEKQGTFINQQFRIQKFLQAVPGVNGLTNDLEILALLLNRLNESNDYIGQISNVWAMMQKEIPTLSDLTFEDIPDTGYLMDASAWLHLPFIEGKSLHFDPETFFVNPSKEKKETLATV